MNNSPAHLWALAVPGILTTVNGHDHALLGGAGLAPEAARGRAEALRRDWGVHDRAELLKLLTWLAREGHRKDFNDVCMLDLQVSTRLAPSGMMDDLIDDPALLKSIHFSRRHRARIGTRSLLAWDMTRLVTLAGFGFVLQWISEGEAWSYALAAAQAVQSRYASWEELGQHHLLGREYWAGEWVAHHARAFRSLLDDPSSPWRALLWNTDLRQPDRMIPLQEIVVEPPPPPGPLARMRNPFASARHDAAAPRVDKDDAPMAPSDVGVAPPISDLGLPPAVEGTTGRRSRFVLVAIALTTMVAIMAVALAVVLGALRSRGAMSPPTPRQGSVPSGKKH